MICRNHSFSTSTLHVSLLNLEWTSPCPSSRIRMGPLLIFEFSRTVLVPHCCDSTGKRSLGILNGFEDSLTGSGPILEMSNTFYLCPLYSQSSLTAALLSPYLILCTTNSPLWSTNDTTTVMTTCHTKHLLRTNLFLDLDRVALTSTMSAELPASAQVPISDDEEDQSGIQG